MNQIQKFRHFQESRCMALTIHRQTIMNLLREMTSPIQRETNVGELPVSNRIPKNRSMIDSHLPCPHQYRGIHEFAGYHHRPSIRIPTISEDFSINTAPVPWIIKGYLFMKCSILPAFKILSDIKWHWPVFQPVMLFFITSSLFCGISPCIWMQVAPRIF